MKQFFTKENELLMFVNAFSGFNVPVPCAGEMTPRVIEQPASREEPTAEIPDPQVIKNILNYARSLEVMKPATGAAMFLINN